MLLSAIHKPVSLLLVAVTLILSGSYSIGHCHADGGDAHWLNLGVPVRSAGRGCHPQGDCPSQYHQHFVLLGFEFYLNHPTGPKSEAPAGDQIAVGLPCDGEKLQVAQPESPAAVDIAPAAAWTPLVPPAPVSRRPEVSSPLRLLDDASRLERSGVLRS